MKKSTAGTAAASLLLLVGCRSPLDWAMVPDDTRPQPPSVAASETPERDARRESRDTSEWSEPADARPPQTAPPRELAGGVEADLLRGHQAAAQGRMAEAEEFYRRVLARDPAHPEAHHRLAVFADQRQDFKTAERHYLAALAGKPTDPDLFNDIGYSAMLQRRWQDAERYFHEALRHDASHRNALINLGTLCAQSGRHAQARAAFRLAGSEEEAQARMAALAAPAQEPAAAGPPPGADPTQWLREQMDRAKAESLAQRQQREPHPAPHETAYAPAAPLPQISGNAAPQISPRPQPPARPPAAPARLIPNQWGSAAPVAQHWSGPQITPGERGLGVHHPAATWPEAQSPATVSAPEPAPRGSAVNHAGFAEPRYNHGLTDHRPTPPSRSQASVASWDAAPGQWPVGNAGQPSVAVGDATARAAQIGMQAGPGGLFPAAGETTAAPQPGTWPSTPAAWPSASHNAQTTATAMAGSPTGSAADPLESFQSTVRRQQEELDQLRRQLETARQLPPTTAVPRPSVPAGYNAQPPQWPQYTPPPYNPQAAGSSSAPAPQPAAEYAPPPYNPGAYSPPPYPGAAQ